MIRVLVVDDNPEIAAAVAAILAEWDCDVAVADSGSEAVALAEATTPDVIVLDHDLPDFNGREVHQRLRGRWPDLPIIFTSGNRPDVRDLLQARPDCTAFLPKPFHEDALMALIRAFCGR